MLLTLDTCRVVVFLACGCNRTPTGLFLAIPGVLEVGRRCRDGGRGRCARRQVDGEGEEEARASPSRRSEMKLQDRYLRQRGLARAK